MTDQPQNDQKPTLSLEEELDVLEAVYRVGKEKGLDLLRPEQLKKLMDAGKISQDSSTNEKGSMINKSGIMADDLVVYALEDAIVEILVKNNVYSREEWNVKNEELKIALLRFYTYGYLGIELEDWAYKVRRTLRK